MRRPVFTCSLPGGAILPSSSCQLRHCVCNLEKSYICMMCNCLSFIKKHIRSITKFHSRRHEGVFCGLIPPNKTSSPGKLKWQALQIGSFCQNFGCETPCKSVKTLIEDFLTTVLQSSMEDRKKLVIHLRSAWMTDRIRDFPVVQKQYFTNILHPRQYGTDSCHPPWRWHGPLMARFLGGPLRLNERAANNIFSSWISPSRNEPPTNVEKTFKIFLS